MTDNYNFGGSGFKEAVCINTGRIYDSCSSKDCLEDLRVYFPASASQIIDNASSLRCRKAEVLNVSLDVESVPFNRGFYSVDMTFCFLITVETTPSPYTPPLSCRGIASYSKKVILYGSEGNVKSFRSCSCPDDCGSAKPTARIHVAEPVCLGIRLCDSPLPDDCDTPSLFHGLEKYFDEPISLCPCGKTVYISLGIFSIVQLEREVQMMIPVYDFSIPDKEEGCGFTDDPCELFKKIKFPVNEFFPPHLKEMEEETPEG